MYVVEPPVRVGECPGPGTWRCLACNWRAELKEYHKPLPPCGGECKKDPAVDETAAHYRRIRGLV